MGALAGAGVATAFTPFASFGGGLLIGLAAVLLMALNGRVLGATGILAGLFRPADPAWPMRVALVAGMVAAPAVLGLVTGRPVQLTVPVPDGAVVLGGLIVGLGVSWGGGCTSGHGVCGLARLSPRSVVATAVFLAAAVGTVLVTRHLLGG